MKSGSRSAGRGLLGAGLGAALLVAGATPSAQTPSRVDDVLEGTLGFSAGQVRTLRSGSTVIRSLDTTVREALAHVGAVYIDAPPERFVDRFSDIERFERGSGIPQIGRFGDPPRLEDLGALTLSAEDVASLRTCRVGDCDVKLSAAAMDRFRKDVDWSSASAALQANTINREMIRDLVRAYQADGNAALGHYDDDKEPLLVADQFRALLESDVPVPTPVPALLGYLDTYPRGRPAGARDFFYWTVVDFGLKPTIRVNHVTIYPLDAFTSSGVAYVIAIKQLYANHYFHTTLELRFLIRDSLRQGHPGNWLISVTRSRNDGMTGFKGLFLRSIIRGRSRDAVRGYLEHVKRQVERPRDVTP